MKISTTMNAVRMAIAVAVMAAGASHAQPPTAPADARRYADEARKVAGDLVAQIRAELSRELEYSGPMRAVIVCKYTVPELSSNASRKSGWRVSRVSLRPRNPALGGADAWEQKTLLDFERRLVAGEKADALEHSEIVTEPGGRYFRFMKALPTGPLCVSCHGPAERMTDAVRSLLATEYPHDRATGFSAGQIRGAVTIKRPL